MQQVTKRLFNFRYRYFFIMNTELDPKEYLLKIVNSVAVLLLWMMPNLFFGLYKGNDNHILKTGPNPQIIFTILFRLKPLPWYSFLY